jgi:hypothetical protein
VLRIEEVCMILCELHVCNEFQPCEIVIQIEIC